MSEVPAHLKTQDPSGVAEPLRGAAEAGEKAAENPFDLATELADAKIEHEGAAVIEKAAKNKLAEISDRMLVAMEAAGVQKLTAKTSDGKASRTMYRHEQLRAGIPADKLEEAAPLLEKVGAGFLLKRSVNANSLSAWIKEKDQTEDGTPILGDTALQKLVTVFKQVTVKVVKG